MLNERGRLSQMVDDEDDYPQWVDVVETSQTGDLFDNPYALRQSLDAYIANINRELTQQFQKSIPVDRPDLSLSSFRLHTFASFGFYFPEEAIEGMPCFDGDVSVLLSSQLPQSKMARIIAVASMIRGSELPKYFPVPDYGANTITIVQLQGQAEQIIDRPEVKVLRYLPWVDFFVQDVVKPWSVNIQADTLGIVSSEIIAQEHPQVSRDRLQKRYDYTAKRHGFTMNPGGVHLLSLR